MRLERKPRRNCSQAKKHENMKPAEARQLWKVVLDYSKRRNSVLVNLHFQNTCNCATVKWKTTEKPQKYRNRSSYHLYNTLLCAADNDLRKPPTCRRKRNPVTKSERFNWQQDLNNRHTTSDVNRNLFHSRYQLREKLRGGPS